MYPDERDTDAYTAGVQAAETIVAGLTAATVIQRAATALADYLEAREHAVGPTAPADMVSAASSFSDGFFAAVDRLWQQ